MLSRSFKFFLGLNETEIVVHEEAIANQSPALEAMMRGNMAESTSGTAKWHDIEEQTFVRFAQFAYTGDYSVPLVAMDATTISQEHEDPQVVLETPSEEFYFPAEDVVQWGLSTKKKAKSGRIADKPPPRPFGSLTYPLLQPRSKFADTCDPVVVCSSEGDIMQGLLCHVSLYILAEKWGIDSLKALTLFKLHKTLCIFPLDESKVFPIVELARSGYSGTPDLENRMDELRVLICQYVAANAKVMYKSKDFQDLIEEGGAFVRDLFKCMLPRMG